MTMSGSEKKFLKFLMIFKNKNRWKLFVKYFDEKKNVWMFVVGSNALAFQGYGLRLSSSRLSHVVLRSATGERFLHVMVLWVVHKTETLANDSHIQVLSMCVIYGVYPSIHATATIFARRLTLAKVYRPLKIQKNYFKAMLIFINLIIGQFFFW